MKAFASDKAVRLGAEGLVLRAEIDNGGDVNMVVLKCHGVTSSIFFPEEGWSLLCISMHNVVYCKICMCVAKDLHLAFGRWKDSKDSFHGSVSLF